MIDPDSLAWGKMDGLLPAVVRDVATGNVLMLGYMNRAALDETQAIGLVTFFSRSKQRLWRKGETSGNILRLATIAADCDGDALLITAEPAGPTCHLGTESCFGVEPAGAAWLGRLERIVAERADASPQDSYTARLLTAGPAKVAQKVGEEGVEVALAAVTRDREGVCEEAADLLFHLAILLRSRDIAWSEVTATLQARNVPVRTSTEQSC